MNINLLVDNLPEIATLVMTIVFTIFVGKFLPSLKSSRDNDQIKIVRQWAKFLVESAERLEISDKLNEVTKKEYVMDKLMELVEKNGYSFTEDQLNDIRRAAVIIYENTYKMAEITVDTLLEEVGAE